MTSSHRRVANASRGHASWSLCALWGLVLPDFLRSPCLPLIFPFPPRIWGLTVAGMSSFLCCLSCPAVTVTLQVKQVGVFQCSYWKQCLSSITAMATRSWWSLANVL